MSILETNIKCLLIKDARWKIVSPKQNLGMTFSRDATQTSAAIPRKVKTFGAWRASNRPFYSSLTNSCLIVSNCEEQLQERSMNDCVSRINISIYTATAFNFLNGIHNGFLTDMTEKSESN